MNKKNSYDYKKILILISLMIIFSLNFLMPNIYMNENGYFDNPNDDTIKELENNDLRSQGLTSDNNYTGIGAAWNLTHWANRTDNNLEVSFENNSYDIKNMPLDIGWNGYKLNATINELYDKRNWVNGTFHAGPDDNDDDCPENDSIYLQNWTFYEDDVINWNNAMSGNYFDSTDDPTGTGNDVMELRMNGALGNSYDKFDKCWWETIFTLPRGNVIEGELDLMMYPWTQYNPQDGGTGEYGTHWSVQIIINGVLIDDKNLIWIEITGNGGWAPLKLQLTNWLNDDTVFPTGVKNMNLTIQLIRNGASLGYPAYGSYQQVLIDNVSLIVKAEAKPEQIDLHINQTNYVNDIDWGEGIVEIDGNWNGTQYPWVHANFSSGKVWPSELGGYDVDFKTDLNLFANKSSPETNYETNTASLGTSFSVSNDSLVNWECYGYTSVPTGYAETEMRLEFPTDVNITWVSYPSAPLTNKLDLDSCDNSTAGLLIVDVSEISATPDGFWKFEALSPNYCEQLNIFKNTTNTPTGNDWTPDNEFLSGQYINITGKITNNPLISDYIQATKATLQIRFPNGTIWSDKTQEKNPIANGFIYFDPVLIPPTTPAYEVGEYDAIIMWNNSHSIYGLNETGIIYKKFTVMHNSTLIPDQSYYADIFESTLINLKVSFNDLVDGKAIEDALVYTNNFTHPSIMQNFSEISPGYYVLLDFNVSGGNPGENNITIYANSSLYTNNEVNITIELIVETTLTAEEYPYLQVPWNTNFTIHLNYTEKKSSNGITTTPIVNWNGDIHTVIDDPGEYNITCNSSAYEVNKLHSLIIDADEYGYESQTILIKIEIIEREAYLDDIFINNSDCMNNKSYNVKSGILLNITVKYKDNETDGTYISNATVKLVGKSINKNFTENILLQHYNITLNTTDLGVGVFFLTISAKKDNYSSASELLTITVFERGTNYSLFLNGTDKTSEPSIKLNVNQQLNITISYRDSISMEHISGAIVDINGSGISDILEDYGFNNYSLKINTSDLNQGVNFLTIYARRDNYEPQSILLTIEIIQVETNLTLLLDGADKTIEPAIKRTANQTLNITVLYRELKTPYNHIPGASTNLTGPGLNYEIEENSSLKHYNLTLNLIVLNQGVNFLTIYALKPNYQPQSIILTIEIIPIESNLTLFLNDTDYTKDPDIDVTIGDKLNITITYEDLTGTHIDNATVKIVGGFYDNFSLMENKILKQYSIIINSTDLDWGVNFLTVLAQKTNYEPQTITIKIMIIDIKTIYYIFLNNENQTSYPNRYIKLNWSETLNITLMYMVNTTDYPHITGATVEITGTGFSETLNESGQQYEILINTTDLGVGITYLTIISQQTNYQPQTIVIKVEITNREAFIDKIFINNQDRTSEKSYEIAWNENLTISITYNDTETKNFIENANVSLTGTGFSIDMNQVGQIYTITFNTIDLGVGIIYLTISAEKNNYTFVSVGITIIIYKRNSSISEIIINGENKTSEKSYEIAWNELLTISITYNDTETKEFIENAKVSLTGTGFSIDMNQIGKIYTITINTTDFSPGIMYLTISAEKNNYTSASEGLTIIINNRETDLEIFINGENKTSEKSYEIAWNELLTISILYNDIDMDCFIEGASVFLTGTGISETLMKSGPQYTVTLNTAALVVGVYYLTISAQKVNYSSQIVVIKIKILDRETYLNVSLNENNETIGGFIDLPIGHTLNISINFIDNTTNIHISNGTVKLVGEGFNVPLIENLLLKQYSIIINTSQLDIGIRFLTIYANKTNSQSSTILLTIQVNRIKTNITTVSGELVINTVPGDTITLKINLTDLDNNIPIKNAIVTYSTDFAQGELTDPDNDGIYEVALTNVPEGTYIITISVFAGDDYEFKRYRITLNAIKPSEETLIIWLLLFASVAGIVALGSYFVAYQRVLKYPKPVRKIHKFKKTLKKKKSPDVEILSSKVLLKALYNEELDPVAKLFKGKMKYEQPEKQLELKPSKDELIDTLSEISPEESEKNEK